MELSPRGWVAMDIRERIRGQLAGLRRRTVTSGYHGEAAVLMPVFASGGEAHFLLTLRTDEVRTHKGQISFPGGMRQDGENLREAALRETFEEVGLEAARIEILGRFHDYISITGHLVAPFAAYIDGEFTPVPHRGEVAEVMRVPFSVFLDPGRFRTERMLRNGRWLDVYFYRYGSHEIWGLTAHIIKDFLDSLLIESPGRL
jgi:8-oxo-dGTP pyrophosphatase MutT (NUDIX family)